MLYTCIHCYSALFGPQGITSATKKNLQRRLPFFHRDIPMLIILYTWIQTTWRSFIVDRQYHYDMGKISWYDEVVYDQGKAQAQRISQGHWRISLSYLRNFKLWPASVSSWPVNMWTIPMWQRRPFGVWKCCENIKVLRSYIDPCFQHFKSTVRSV